MEKFDPYNDRIARDIRNTLSSALVNELTGNGDALLSTVADEWLAQVLAPIYQAYIKEKQVLYRQAIGEIKSCNATDPRYQAISLWNLGLFFEMHELLETIWQNAFEPERTALKGWIQAAGVYVHYHRGKPDAALGLAQRAVKHLRKGRGCLGFIANLDQLIEALANPSDAAPQITTTNENCKTP